MRLDPSSPAIHDTRSVPLHLSRRPRGSRRQPLPRETSQRLACPGDSRLAVCDRHSQDRPGPSLPDGMGIGDDKLMEMVAGLERRLGSESVELPDGREQIVAPEVQDLHSWALGDLDQPNKREGATFPPPCLIDRLQRPWTPVAVGGSSTIWRQSGVGPDISSTISSTVSPGSIGQVTSRTIARVPPRRTRSTLARTASLTVRRMVVARRKSAASRGPAPWIASKRRDGTTTRRGRCVDA